MNNVYGFIAFFINKKELYANRKLAPAQSRQLERRFSDIDDIMRLVTGMNVESNTRNKVGVFTRCAGWL